MPTLKHPRLERFAQALFANNSKFVSEAGKVVGYTPGLSRAMAARPDVKMRVEELKQLSANAVIANESERRAVLTKIIRHDIELPVSAGHITQAIAEINKMEHIYQDAPGNQDNRTLNIIVLNKETKGLIAGIAEWTKKPPAGAIEGTKA